MQPIFLPNDYNTILVDNFFRNVPELERKRSLIAQWQENLRTGFVGDHKEESLQSLFLTTIFAEVLGYSYQGDVWNLEIEQRTTHDTTKSDGALGFFRVGAEPDVRAVIELKAHGINLDKPQSQRSDTHTPVEQAFDYARKMGARCEWVIVSDFEELRLYRYPDARRYEEFLIPNLLNPATDDDTGIEAFQLKRFFYLLAKDRLFYEREKDYDQAPVRVLYTGRINSLKTITAKFYDGYRTQREQLFFTLRRMNPTTDFDEVLQAAQKLIDRLLFMRFASDVGLTLNVLDVSRKYLTALAEPVPLHELNLGWQYVRLLFRSFDKGYNNKIPPFNGGLFAPDERLEQLRVPDEAIETLERFLLSYNFKHDLKVDILGHIFEQSITDLERLRRLKPSSAEAVDAKRTEETSQEISKEHSTSKRKQEGVFYTPEAVTEYIIRQSVGAWLADCKSEILNVLGVDDISQPEDDFLRWKADNAAIMPDLTFARTIELHLAFWERYQSALESIKILDPACGSGAFLTRVFDFLWDEWRVLRAETIALRSLLVEEQAKTQTTLLPLRSGNDGMLAPKSRKKAVPKAATSNEITMSIDEHTNEREEIRLKKRIITENLFGVDLNIESVEITQLSLWLKTAHKQESLANLSHAIKRGNSLISKRSVAGDTAFKWDSEFPDVAMAGGFDVVVGNPPYVSANNMDYREREYLNKEKDFTTLAGKWDLYVAFIEKGLRLLKPNGYLSFIVPYGLLNQPFAEQARAFILDHYMLCSIADLHTVRIFEQATVPCCIPVIKHVQSSNHEVSIVMLEGDEFVEQYRLPVSTYQTTALRMFRTENLALTTGLLERIKKRGTSLGNLFYVSTGAEIHGKEHRSERGKLTSGASKFDRLYDTQREGLKPYIEGAAIPKSPLGRYCYPSINSWLDYSNPDAMRSPKFSELFDSEKIIVRRSSGLLGILATYDERKVYTSEKCLLIVSKTDVPHDHEQHTESSPYSLKYLLAVLNSRVMDFYYKSVYSGFIDVYPNYLKALPIPAISPTEQEPFVRLVNEVLECRKAGEETFAQEQAIERLVEALFGVTDADSALIQANAL